MRKKIIEVTVPGQEIEMSYICVFREGEGVAFLYDYSNWPCEFFMECGIVCF
jgi:hypothetical protein